MEIKAYTFGNAKKWKTPVVNIECDNMEYFNDGVCRHGIQISEQLAGSENKLKTLCAEISDRMIEIYKIVNE